MNAFIYLKRLFWVSAIALFITSCASNTNTSSSAAEDDDMYYTSKDRKKEMEAKRQEQARRDANTGKPDAYNPNQYTAKQPPQQTLEPEQPEQTASVAAPPAPQQKQAPSQTPSPVAPPQPQVAQVPAQNQQVIQQPVPSQQPAAAQRQSQPVLQEVPSEPKSNSDIYVESKSYSKKYHQQSQPTAQEPPPPQQQHNWKGQNNNGYNQNSNNQNNQQQHGWKNSGQNNNQPQQSSQPAASQPSSSKSDVYVYEFKPNKPVAHQGTYSPGSSTYNADDYDNNTFASKYFTSVVPLYPGFNPYGELNITFGYYPWHKGTVYDPYFYPRYNWGAKYGYRPYFSRR